MNLSSMDYFITLAQEQSFTRAAERLHITQQALSAHIAGMEQELGSQLLLRRVPLELTYAGQVFLRYAQEIQRNLDSMDREFSDLAQAQAGVLRIGVSTTRSHAVMPLLIAPFQRQYPKISIQLAEGPNDALSERLTWPSPIFQRRSPAWSLWTSMRRRWFCSLPGSSGTPWPERTPRR